MIPASGCFWRTDSRDRFEGQMYVGEHGALRLIRGVVDADDKEDRELPWQELGACSYPFCLKIIYLIA